MTLQSEAAADVLRLLTDAGASGTLSRFTPGAYDPETGDTAAGTTETWSVIMTLTNFKSRELSGQHESSGRILANEKKALIATPGLATTPQSGDDVIFGGVTYKISAVQIVELNALPIVFICQVSSGS
jgi:hypothetical protein